MDGGAAPDGDRTTPPEPNTDQRFCAWLDFSQEKGKDKSYFCVVL